MSKILVMMICSVMIISMVACGSSNTSSSDEEISIDEALESGDETLEDFESLSEEEQEEYLDNAIENLDEEVEDVIVSADTIESDESEENEEEKADLSDLVDVEYAAESE